MKIPHQLRLAKYRIDFLRHYVRAFGFRARNVYRRLHSSTPSEKLVTVHPPGLPHPVFLRPGSSDVTVFEKIFIWREYRLTPSRGVQAIIDCGANTGLSAVWFASRFPGIKVIAIEPSVANYELLRRNTTPYPSITPIHAAVWGKTCHVAAVTPHAGFDSFRFAECAADAPGCVPAVDLDTLITTYASRSSTLVKIDIEGGEDAVFRGSVKWLDDVELLIVEFHSDAFRRDAIRAIVPSRWRHSIVGENDCFTKIS